MAYQYVPQCSKPGCSNKTTDPTGRCHHHRVPDQVGKYSKKMVGSWDPTPATHDPERDNLTSRDTATLSIVLNGIMADPEFTYEQMAAAVVSYGWRQDIYDATSYSVAVEAMGEVEYDGDECTGSDVVATLEAFGFKRTDASAEEEWYVIQDFMGNYYEGLEDHETIREVGGSTTMDLVYSTEENLEDWMKSEGGPLAWARQGNEEYAGKLGMYWGLIDGDDYHTQEMVETMRKMIADKIADRSDGAW